jgi:hypothetical protein
LTLPGFLIILAAQEIHRSIFWRIAMWKQGILILSALIVGMGSAQAGVAPAQDGNKMTASGAKIAPPSKPTTEEQKEEKNSETKEQPPKQ